MKNEENPSMYKCLCGQERPQKVTEHTNLLNHLKQAHPDYNKTVLSAKKNAFQGAHFHEDTVSDKTVNVYGWLEVVIRGLRPLFLSKGHAFEST